MRVLCDITWMVKSRGDLVWFLMQVLLDNDLWILWMTCGIGIWGIGCLDKFRQRTGGLLQPIEDHEFFLFLFLDCSVLQSCR